MKKSDPRAEACRIITRVTVHGVMSREELHAAFLRHPEWDTQQRHFLTALVMGTLGNLRLLDHMLDRHLKKPLSTLRPQLRSIFRMGAYQILFLDGVPDAAAVNESVSLACDAGFGNLRGLVNGVLRNLCRDKTLPEKPAALRCSVPDELETLLREQYGAEQAAGILRSFQEPEPVCVRILPSRKDRQTILDSLARDGIGYTPLPWVNDGYRISGFSRVEDITAFSRGWLLPQSAGSMLAGQIAAPRQGDNVLDLCAAPGGKSMDMADLMHDRGSLTAADIDPERLKRIKENIVRCGFSCVRVIQNDASLFRPEWEGKMDVVLADLPCSGLGTIAHRPEIRMRISPAYLEEAAALQTVILRHAWRYLKPGGILVYSTCTVNRGENEEVFRRLLSESPLEPVGLGNRITGEDPGDTWQEGFFTLLPGIHQSGGFFVSCCRRLP